MTETGTYFRARHFLPDTFLTLPFSKLLSFIAVVIPKLMCDNYLFVGTII